MTSGYDALKSQIKPFDLIFFIGGEKISSTIRFIQRVSLGVENKLEVWSHVGLVVTRDLLDDKRLEPGKLYLIESTLSGKFNDGIKNVDGKSFFGVQIRDLDQLVKKYAGKKKRGIAWSRLHNNPFRLTSQTEDGLLKQKEIQFAFTTVWPVRWEGIRYNFNLISLAASVWPAFKPLDWLLLKFDFLNTDDWLFCSELVFDILQVFKFYDKHIDASSVLPQDFLGYDNSTPGIPCIFDDPIRL